MYILITTQIQYWVDKRKKRGALKEWLLFTYITIAST